MNGGKEFEAETASRLGALGWITSLTAVTGDWGADVVAKTDKETLVVQCKDWSGPAGLTAIQEVNFARTHYQAHMAIVVSRNGYTRAAKEAAKTTGVHLFSLEVICADSAFLDRTKERDHQREQERRKRAQEAEESNRGHAREIEIKEARQRAYIQESKIKIEKDISLIWQRFDDAVIWRKGLLSWIKLIGIIMIFFGLSGIYFFIPKDVMKIFEYDYITISTSIASVFIIFGILLISDLPYPVPKAPDLTRRAALRHCPCCELRLKVEVARSGWLTCPRCKWRFHAQT